MTAKKIKKGILITNSYFTNDALMFASENSIETIDVATLARQIIKLEPSKKRRLLDFIETHDYTTPTCPNCEIKLVLRTTKKGKNIGKQFWGCQNYPRCHYVLPYN